MQQVIQFLKKIIIIKTTNDNKDSLIKIFKELFSLNFMKTFEIYNLICAKKYVFISAIKNVYYTSFIFI